MHTEIVRTIVTRCLGYRKGEQFLIVCDDKLYGLAHDFYRVTRTLGVESMLLSMKTRTMHGEEPPDAIAAALQHADAAVLLTSMSLSHTKARKTASKQYGTRIASLPGATEAMLERAIPINYASLRKRAGNLSRMLTKAQRIEIRTKRGTHLTMSLKGRRGFSDDGMYTRRGAFGNLPAGEACISPREGTTNGRLIVDGSAPLIGRIKRPLEILIKDGYAQNVPFSKMAPLVKSLGRRVLNIAELGLGLNTRAKVTGSTLEDEKVYQTAHIALGNNKSFGGTVSCPCHLDFVFFQPTILVDGVEKKI